MRRVSLRVESHDANGPFFSGALACCGVGAEPAWSRAQPSSARRKNTALRARDATDIRTSSTLIFSPAVGELRVYPRAPRYSISFKESTEKRPPAFCNQVVRLANASTTCPRRPPHRRGRSRFELRQSKGGTRRGYRRRVGDIHRQVIGPRHITGRARQDENVWRRIRICIGEGDAGRRRRGGGCHHSLGEHVDHFYLGIESRRAHRSIDGCVGGQTEPKTILEERILNAVLDVQLLRGRYRTGGERQDIVAGEILRRRVGCHRISTQLTL